MDLDTFRKNLFLPGRQFRFLPGEVRHGRIARKGTRKIVPQPGYFSPLGRDGDIAGVQGAFLVRQSPRR